MSRTSWSAAQTLADALIDAKEPAYVASLIDGHVLSLSRDEQDNIVSALRNTFVQEVYSNHLRAETAIERILELAKRGGRPIHQAHGLACLAQLAAIREGNYQLALAHYTDAEAICVNEGDELTLAHMDVTRVAVLGNTGDHKTARIVSRRARAVLETAEAWEALAALQMNTAVALTHCNHFEEAIALLHESDTLLARIGESATPARLRAAVTHAHCLTELGRYNEALRLGEDIIDQCQTTSLADVRRLQQLNNARIRYCIGEYTRALSELDMLAYEFDKAEHRHLQSMATLSAADCLIHLRRFDEAIYVCTILQQRLETLGDPHSLGQLHLTRALALAGVGRRTDALLQIEHAHSAFAAHGDRYYLATTDWLSAAVALDAGDPLSALDRAESSLRVFTATKGATAVEPLLARILVVKALALIGQVTHAQDQVDELARLVPGDAAIWNYEVANLRATIALASADTSAAIMHLQTAIDKLEQSQFEVAVELRATFLVDRRQCYRQLIVQLLARGESQLAFEYSVRSKARSLTEQVGLQLRPSIPVLKPSDQAEVSELEAMLLERNRLIFNLRSHDAHRRSGEDSSSSQAQILEQLTTLESRLRDRWRALVVRNAEYAPRATQWLPSYQAPGAYLSRGETLLEFTDTGSGYVVFIVTQDAVKHFDLSIRPNSISRSLARLDLIRTSHVEQRDPSASTRHSRHAQAILTQLYDGLIRPVRAHLKAATALTIVPCGLLKQVPFAALYDGEVYLTERFSIATAPGSGLLAHLSGRVEPTDKLVAFGFACNGRLPRAEREAEAIASSWLGSAHCGRSATLERVSHALSTADVVHLATHAISNPSDPMLSGIQLFDGWLTALDIHAIRVRAKVVVLSACETGKQLVHCGIES